MEKQKALQFVADKTGRSIRHVEDDSVVFSTLRKAFDFIYSDVNGHYDNNILDLIEGVTIEDMNKSDTTNVLDHLTIVSEGIHITPYGIVRSNL